LETFPTGDNEYNLLEEDLEKCTGLFFCYDQDIEDNCFDYDKATAYAIIYNLETNKEYTIAVTLER
jgi:ferredoxin